MEPAKIDWKSIESVYIEDELYEHISAPKWIDFSAPDESLTADEVWFCRPDCRHPKAAEDFLNPSPNSPVDVRERLLLGERNRRDPNLKRRGPAIPLKNNAKSEKFTEDGENQNPNLSTLHHQGKIMKGALESSTEEKKLTDDKSQNGEMPQNSNMPWLKRTLSARNLFAGRDILNQVTEFCHELKRLAMRAKERENETLNGKISPVDGKKPVVKEADGEREVPGELDDTQKERKPLLEMSKQTTEPVEKNNGKHRRKKRVDEAENTPPPPFVDMKNMKRREESVLQIKTNPPSPQCFSAARGTSKVTPLKPSRSKPPVERDNLQDLEQRNTEVRKVQAEDEGNKATNVSNVAEREARAMDLLWFLKPCTLSN